MLPLSMIFNQVLVSLVDLVLLQYFFWQRETQCKSVIKKTAELTSAVFLLLYNYHLFMVSREDYFSELASGKQMKKPTLTGWLLFDCSTIKKLLEFKVA
jgi:hypothetical protein